MKQKLAKTVEKSYLLDLVSVRDTGISNGQSERNYKKIVICTFGIQLPGRCTDRQADGYKQNRKANRMTDFYSLYYSAFVCVKPF